MASDRRRWDTNDGLTTVELEAAAAPSSARSATASSHMPYRIGGDRFAGGVDCPPAWPVLAMSNHPSYPAWPPAGPPEPRERGRRGLREYGRVIAAESKPAMTLALLQDWWQGGYRTQAEHGQPPGPDAAPTYLRLSYGSEPVGRLVLAEPGRRVELAPADRRLLGDLARQVGVAVHSIQAGEEAARLSVDLQRSRERLVLACDEERRRIGRDLHDGLGPQLAGLTMTLEAARDLVRADPGRAQKLMAELQGRTELAVEDVRRIAHQLRPPALDALGLVGALRSHAAGEQRVQVTMEAAQPLPLLPAAAEVAAYRIVLEALHNVSSHAQATHCRVTLQAERDPDVLCVLVVDDGRGIPTGAPVGVGQQSMRERAAELGGSCTVRPAEGGGTVVDAVLPLSGRGRSATRGADQHPDL